MIVVDCAFCCLCDRHIDVVILTSVTSRHYISSIFLTLLYQITTN